MENNSSFIYMFHNTETNKFYIGSTLDAENRKKRHLNSLKAGKEGRINLKGEKIKHPNYKFQQAFNENPNFDFIATEVSSFNKTKKENRLDAEKVELEIIKENWNDPDILNLTTIPIPMLVGNKLTDETKIKQSKSALLGWQMPGNEKRREIVSNTSKNLSDEEKKKRSDRMKIFNNNISPEVRKENSEKIKEAWTDPELRKQQSENRLNHFSNGGFKYNLGLPISEEKLEKLCKGRDNFYNSLTEEEKLELIKRKTEPNKKPIEVDGKIYSSRKEAAISENVTPPTVRDRINSKNFPGWKYI